MEKAFDSSYSLGATLGAVCPTAQSYFLNLLGRTQLGGIFRPTQWMINFQAVFEVQEKKTSEGEIYNQKINTIICV